MHNICRLLNQWGTPQGIPKLRHMWTWLLHLSLESWWAILFFYIHTCKKFFVRGSGDCPKIPFLGSVSHLKFGRLNFCIMPIKYYRSSKLLIGREEVMPLYSLDGSLSIKHQYIVSLPTNTTCMWTLISIIVRSQRHAYKLLQKKHGYMQRKRLFDSQGKK